MANEELGYVGDGVYLSYDGWQFWLAANDHNNKVIALEPDVVFGVIRGIVKHRPEYIPGIMSICNQEKNLREVEDDLDQLRGSDEPSDS